MPFVEVFTREKLSNEVRAKLAEELSDTGPDGVCESCKREDSVRTKARRLRAYPPSSICYVDHLSAGARRREGCWQLSAEMKAIQIEKFGNRTERCS